MLVARISLGRTLKIYAIYVFFLLALQVFEISQLILKFILSLFILLVCFSGSLLQTLHLLSLFYLQFFDSVLLFSQSSNLFLSISDPLILNPYFILQHIFHFPLLFVAYFYHFIYLIFLSCYNIFEFLYFLLSCLELIS